ncbi:ABC transporter permease [Meridianimarinicoccus sp. RP-17]|uniref:ABC transporter permease n=1 Tax=Meridianimarinicoccus zhengii TaxID=2056810 RepID=UPI000DAC8462|nr:ABC transporter permease [Phycocomes zhengii]
MLIEAVRLAVQAIFRNALRSFLTVLGIVIGVASVIAMVTVGQGSTEQVASDVEKLGANVVIVVPGQDAMRGGPHGTTAPMFSTRINDTVKARVAAVAVSAPISQTRERVIFGNANRLSDVVGTDNRYFEAARWEVAAGRLFEPGEIQAGRAVCIVGETLRQALFGAGDPVGASVRIGAVSCRVIGLLRSKGASTFGADQDDFVILPLATFHRRIAGNADVQSLFVSVRDGASIDAAREDITALMRELRRIGPGEEDDFEVLDTRQFALMLTGITDVLTGLLSAVAAVSLLVGGIGIMNIMLVSVTERTREIGIRLAIGARARDVLTQFLVEAIILSMLGGVIGILMGLGLALAGARWLAVPFSPDPGVVLLSFGFSAFVGIVFGFFPARRAARLDPIEALRHE